MAPKIDRKNVRNITIKEGEPIFLDIKVFGEPAPEVSWLVNGKSILQTTHRRIENVPYNTKFSNDNPERKDTGTYKITATNLYGSDTADIEINVICKYIQLKTYLFYNLVNKFFFALQQNHLNPRVHLKCLTFTKMVVH